jgi:hypothetical protein
MYSVDTNIYLDWWVRRYPDDLFPTIKTHVEALISAGKWRSTQGVAAEITHNGTPRLKAWAQANSGQFLAHDAALLKEANAITTAYPGLLDPCARHDEADRYVIALAKLHGWAVVTHETPARWKKYAVRTHFIPDVCRGLGVPCIEFLELMRREKWSFR